VVDNFVPIDAMNISPLSLFVPSVPIHIVLTFSKQNDNDNNNPSGARCSFVKTNDKTGTYVYTILCYVVTYYALHAISFSLGSAFTHVFYPTWLPSNIPFVF